MNDDKRFRTVTIKMPVTKKDYLAFKNVMSCEHWGALWEVTTELSHAPQLGEIWEDGWGTRFRIIDVDPNQTFPIMGKSDFVEDGWTAGGIVIKGTDFSMKNLVQRVIPNSVPLDIHPGEYWMLENGDVVVKIKEIDKRESPPDIYVIHERNGSKTWTINGIYDITVPNSGYNLKCKVNVILCVGEGND